MLFRRTYNLFLLILGSSPFLSNQMTSPLEQLRWNWTHSCATPLMEPVGDCAVNINKYFYNKTTKMCERFYWNGCLRRGVYETRLECALSCNPGESAGRCSQTPPKGCSPDAMTSSWPSQPPTAWRRRPAPLTPSANTHTGMPWVKTRPLAPLRLPLKTRPDRAIAMTQPLEPQYQFDAYYYDNVTRTCKHYKFCGPESVPQGTNFFTTVTDCIMECEGFPIVNTSRPDAYIGH
ncbi:tissue factor pathway inhibitor [Rhipicephalus sanguineus]|uniref:tissue factor pathway inhibitor n=1 Tax=Rhipicephalus sanguineus TaxID=34632 RepID=UPI0018945EB8|nr:tissue factor pathway inhibitor [Rhipicephalus sanguineus]